MVDVGFGRGGNLMLFARSGYETHGLEVSQESVNAARQLAAAENKALTLGLIEGTSLPYADSFFDIIVSWNAVYYFETRTRVREAIADFHRVLRPGGVLLMSLIHPNSFMIRRLTDAQDDGAYLIDRADPHDNRHGSRIFFDPTSSGWRALLSPFAAIEEGYAEADLFVPARRDAWRLFLARK
jgi:SAM-dependent methyltransferase